VPTKTCLETQLHRLKYHNTTVTRFQFIETLNFHFQISEKSEARLGGRARCGPENRVADEPEVDVASEDADADGNMDGEEEKREWR
jgi:hypothetical protein